jgi:hypothetical protein
MDTFPCAGANGGEREAEVVPGEVVGGLRQGAREEVEAMTGAVLEGAFRGEL